MENIAEEYPADYSVFFDDNPPDPSTQEMRLRILHEYGQKLQPIPFAQLSPSVVNALEMYYRKRRATPYVRDFLPDAQAPGRLLNLGVRFTLDEAREIVRKLPEDSLTDDDLENPKYRRPVVLLNHVKWCLEDILYDEDSELCQYHKFVTFISTPSHQQHNPACGVLTLHPKHSWPDIESQTGDAKKVIDNVFTRVKTILGCDEMEIQWHFNIHEFTPSLRHNGPWKPFNVETVLGPWAKFYHPGVGLIVNDEGELSH